VRVPGRRQAGMHAGEWTEAGGAVGHEPHIGQVWRDRSPGDDRFLDDRTEPASEVLDERAIACRQGRLVATHAAAEAAGKDHEAAVGTHGKSLTRRLTARSRR